jgi:hypothetical protein
MLRKPRLSWKNPLDSEVSWIGFLATRLVWTSLRLLDIWTSHMVQQSELVQVSSRGILSSSKYIGLTGNKTLLYILLYHTYTQVYIPYSTILLLPVLSSQPLSRPAIDPSTWPLLVSLHSSCRCYHHIPITTTFTLTSTATLACCHCLYFVLSEQQSVYYMREKVTQTS